MIEDHSHLARSRIGNFPKSSQRPCHIFVLLPIAISINIHLGRRIPRKRYSTLTYHHLNPHPAPAQGSVSLSTFLAGIRPFHMTTGGSPIGASYMGGYLS
jgi:hypothetical protein